MSRLLICLLPMLLLLGCSDDSPTSKISVGSILALSGDSSSFGIKQKQAFELAVSEINSQGGVLGQDLVVQYTDSRMEIEIALAEYKRLKAMGTDVIIGISGSKPALHIAPQANIDQIPLLSSLDTSHSLTTKGGDFFLRNVPSDLKAFDEVVNWSRERGTLSTTIIFNSEEVWAQDCKQTVESYLEEGELAIPAIAVLKSTTDFSGVISTLASTAKLNSVFVCLFGRQAGLLVSQAQNASVHLSYYSGDGFSQTEFIDNAQSAATNAFYVMPSLLASTDYKAFVDAYTDAYGSAPDAIAAKAYDLMHMLAIALNAIDEKDVTGKAIRDALLKVEYKGVTGINAFDKNGDLQDATFSRFTYSPELSPLRLEP